MKTGAIIRTKENIHNYPERDGDRWEYIYFKFNDGPYELEDYGEVTKWDGKHFICIGSTYSHHMAGKIFSLDILDDEHEEVDGVEHELVD